MQLQNPKPVAEPKLPESGMKPPLVVIVGPTAVGKTEISIQLAERLDAEVVSADSRLLYCGMDIGTAKPNPEERRRVAHHLIDVAEPDEVWSLAVFKDAARKAIAGVHGRHGLPLLVGGTGQYVRAVIEEWKIPQVEPDERLRSVLKEWAAVITPRGLHRRLAALDAETAVYIEPNNLRRTIRALEVIFETGERFSQQKRRGVAPYRHLVLGLTRPRVELYARIDERIQEMLNAGFVEEVRLLLEKGYSPKLPTMSAIGYREIIDYLQGRTTLEEAVRLIQRRTRIFVRRQANWFKLDDPNMQWFEAGPETVGDMEAVIHKWLAVHP